MTKPPSKPNSDSETNHERQRLPHQSPPGGPRPWRPGHGRPGTRACPVGCRRQLAHQAGAHHQSVPRGRRAGRHLAPGGRQAGAPVEPARHRGKPPWRQRLHRHRGLQARRHRRHGHHPAGQRPPGRLSPPVQETALQHRQGLRGRPAAVSHLLLRLRAGQQPLQDRGRPDCRRQGAPRQAQLRLVVRGQPGAPGLGPAGVADGHQDGTRHLQGNQPAVHQRGHGRAGLCAGLLGHGRPADALGQAALSGRAGAPPPQGL